MIRRSLSILVVVLFVALHSVAATLVFPGGLSCEGRGNALGIDLARPALTWKVQTTDGSQQQLSQRAYQVLVASTPKILAQDRGDLWDSGKINSAESQFIHYAGQPLRSSQRVFWKVRLWDQDGNRSAWSAPTE